VPPTQLRLLWLSARAQRVGAGRVSMAEESDRSRCPGHPVDLGRGADRAGTHPARARAGPRGARARRLTDSDVTPAYDSL
jgi:hypothetical protein